MLKRLNRPKPNSSERSRNGALRQIFVQEESGLLRLAILLVGQREVAEEMVQEVFLRLHLKWEEVEQPRAWLYKSLKNRILNHLRDERSVTPDSDEFVASVANKEESTIDVVSRLEAIHLVRGLLDSLPEEDRNLLRLKYFEGMRYREISEQTGQSVGHIGNRLHHLLKRLAKKLHLLETDSF